MKRKRSPQQIDEYNKKWKLGKYNTGYAIKAMLGGVLTMVIGFIGTLLGTVLLFVLDLKLLWKKMVSKNQEQKYTTRKR